MPRRKMMTRQAKGILLVRPYEPNKSNDAEWRACCRNSDLIHVLLCGEKQMLDGANDFASEEERREAWERNKMLVMGLKGIGWHPDTDYTYGPHEHGYVVGSRPWGFMHYDLKTDFPPKWPERFDPAQFEYLKSHGLLEPGEEELVEMHRRKIAEGWATITRTPAGQVAAVEEEEDLD